QTNIVRREISAAFSRLCAAFMRHNAAISEALRAVARATLLAPPRLPGRRRASSEESMSNPVLIIPARMASTRLPGKPLADIGGAPMILHVWRRAREAGLGPVIVACAEREIAAA